MLNHIIRTSGQASCLRNLSQPHSLSKFLRCASNSAAYQGDGKTTVRVLNSEEPGVNLVNTYSAKGFRLSNNLFISGSILLFPTHVYAWGVRRGIDITLESLTVFDLIVPKIKIIVIGYGSQDEPHDRSLAMKLKKKGISCELLATPNAVTTYNYLVSDSVHVAGAFVPVREEVHMTQRDNRGLREHQIMFGEEKHLPEINQESLEYKKKYMEIQSRDKEKKKFDE